MEELKEIEELLSKIKSITDGLTADLDIDVIKQQVDSINSLLGGDNN